MKLKFAFIIALFAFLFVSCTKDDDNKETKKSDVAYIANFGAFNQANGSISTYDIEKKEITNNTYKAANGVALAAGPQSLATYDSKVYVVCNSADKIDVLDAKDLKALSNPISEDLVNPRYFVAKGSYGYVSCWGNVLDWTKMENSYIAKINLSDNSVEKIAVPGGPEGLMIIDNNLYISSNTKNQIAVMNLDNNELSYIHTSAIPHHFVNTGEGKLYTSLIRTYSVPFPPDSIGIGVIDLSSKKMSSLINIPYINGNLSKSNDNKNLYAYTSAYDLELQKNITKLKNVDISDTSYKVEDFIDGQSFTGFEVNPDNGDIYLLVSPDASNPGSMKIYDKSGSLKDEFETGIYPQDVLFISK